MKKEEGRKYWERAAVQWWRSPKKDEDVKKELVVWNGEWSQKENTNV
jgi:hypothetical protein